ncbi:MAG: hypothetical protein IPL61_38225 [Myxococcales bacterium]|nr:hypothetical protein [Myxococcales bacterium]
MRAHLVLTVALPLAAACGGDDGGSPAIDAPAASITSVACGGATVAGTVTAPGFAFEPMATTISVGQVVRFTMPATHNAVSNTAGQFRVDFGGDSCFRFDTAGTFGFHCEPHQFTGTIVVQ